MVEFLGEMFSWQHGPFGDCKSKEVVLFLHGKGIALEVTLHFYRGVVPLWCFCVHSILNSIGRN